MLDSGPAAVESAPSSSHAWSDASASAPTPPAETSLVLQTSFAPRPIRTEHTWTYACILSFAGHIWAVTALVLLAIVWELWLPNIFLPPGASAGGRPAGSSSAGIIGVAPGYQDKESGDSEYSGGILKLGAPDQMGNQLANEVEVAGNVLEAKKFSETQVAAAVPTEPVELPTTEVQTTPAELAERTLDTPPPENNPIEVPKAVMSRRVASTHITTELAAAALQVAPPPQEMAALEVFPQAVVRHETADNALAKAVTPPQETPPATPPKPATPTNSARSATTPSLLEPTDAPAAPEDTKGLARRAGTKVLAKAVTKVELDQPGAGGGMGGPGGRGGAGGRGGVTNNGPGGTGSGQTHGAGGDLSSLLVHAPKPYYPRELDEAAISGKVMVRVEIDPAGNVTSVTLYRTSGYAAFDRSAVEGVAKWKFARLADKPWRSNVYLVPVIYKD